MGDWADDKAQAFFRDEAFAPSPGTLTDLAAAFREVAAEAKAKAEEREARAELVGNYSSLREQISGDIRKRGTP